MTKTYKRKRKVYKKTYGKGIKVAGPYINKRNRFMLGEGKKKQLKNKKIDLSHQLQQHSQDQQSNF